MFCTDVEMKVTTAPHCAAYSQIISCGFQYQAKISLNTARNTIRFCICLVSHFMVLLKKIMLQIETDKVVNGFCFKNMLNIPSNRFLFFVSHIIKEHYAKSSVTRTIYSKLLKSPCFLKCMTNTCKVNTKDFCVAINAVLTVFV